MCRILLLAVGLLVWIACGPSEAQVEEMVKEQVANHR